MDKKILIEPLRERLYIISGDFVTFADSRALIVFTDDLPFDATDRLHSIETLKYFVIENGDMMPYKEDDSQNRIVLFTKSEFEYDLTKREHVVKALYNYISWFYDMENDLDSSIQSTLSILKEMGFYNVSTYESDFIRIFSSTMKEEQRIKNENSSESKGS